MRLVVSEKPSVARSIAAVLGSTPNQKGYLEGNGYLVSWCVGHLVELATPGTYDEKYAKWRAADLPIVPAQWQYIVTDATKPQYNILCSLMNDQRVTGIICATDAGREGELIFRLVYNQCDCRKPVERLWISSMEEAAIAEGFQTLKPAMEFDSLYHAALCRAQADWLVGINATRLFSAMYHQTLNIGRVMTPTLAMLVEREAQISAHQPVSFYTVCLDCGEFSTMSDRFPERTEAERIAALCDGREARIVSLETKEHTENPPKLYDLTSLQRDANRLLGYTALQTLDYTQSLYEKKLCTYPRTDSRFLTSHMVVGVQALAETLFKTLPFPCSGSCNIARVIADSKVSDHHAIIPTASVSGFDVSVLPVGERNILMMLIMRLLCSVGEPGHADETAVMLECEGVFFSTKGRQVKDKGWKAIEEAYLNTLKNVSDDDTSMPGLPPLSKHLTFLPVDNPSKKEKPHRPGISRKIRCFLQWKRQARRICRRMRKGKDWAHPLLAQES